MKRKLLYFLIVPGFMFQVPGFAAEADMDSLSFDPRWKVTGEFDIATPESQLQVTFYGPDSLPVRSKIKIFLAHSDSIGPSSYVGWLDSLVPLYIDSSGTYRASLTPDFYSLTFVHSEYGEVCMTFLGLDFKPYKGISMNVYFTPGPWRCLGGGVRVDKPVIYLYPEEKTEVEVKLDVTGELGFTYPQYNNGWKVTANADGTLEADNKKYNYLFWEGKMSSDVIDRNFTEGFVVHRDTLTAFFETSLTLAGLTSREQQDFITYWVPRMHKNEWNFIHFMFNDEYKSIAELNVFPSPQSVLRVFMLWNEISTEAVVGKKLRKQNITSTNRTGFTVVEWGGSELTSIFRLYGIKNQ